MKIEYALSPATFNQPVINVGKGLQIQKAAKPMPGIRKKGVNAIGKSK